MNAEPFLSSSSNASTATKTPKNMSPSPLSFNIHNLLSSSNSNKPIVQSESDQDLKRPPSQSSQDRASPQQSTSNGTTQNSTKNTSNAPSPSPSCPSPVPQPGYKPCPSPNYPNGQQSYSNKAPMNNQNNYQNMQFQMWKQSPQHQHQNMGQYPPQMMYPHQSPSGQFSPSMFPPSLNQNDNFYYNQLQQQQQQQQQQQHQLMRTVSNSSLSNSSGIDLNQERPPSVKTPQNEHTEKKSNIDSHSPKTKSLNPNETKNVKKQALDDESSKTPKSSAKNKKKESTAKSVTKRQIQASSINPSASSTPSSSCSASSTLSDENISNKIINNSNEENTNEESSSSSSSSSTKSSTKNSKSALSPSPLSFNINNLLSSSAQQQQQQQHSLSRPSSQPNHEGQLSMPSQMLPPPSPSNGSTPSSSSSASASASSVQNQALSKTITTNTNSASPSSSSSSSSSPSLAQTNQSVPPQSAYFSKPAFNNQNHHQNMQYQMWKQSPQQMMHQSPSGQFNSNMFPPPLNPNENYHHYLQQQQFMKNASNPELNQERPPSVKTPQSELNEKRPTNNESQQTPTTPNQMKQALAASLHLNNNSQTPKSPAIITNNSSHFNENSNMLYGHEQDEDDEDEDDDDDSSMTSDEPSNSSPKQAAGSSGSITSSSSSHPAKSSTSKALKSAAKKAAHNMEILGKVIEMGMAADNGATDAQRREFVNKLLEIWKDYSIQCRNLPILSKQVLDVFQLYQMVKEKGGFNEVCKNKLWKDISTVLNTGTSAPAALIVKKKYISLGIFHLECRHDLNGVDPLPLIIEMEKSANTSKKSTSNKNNSSLNNENLDDSLTNQSSKPSKTVSATSTTTTTPSQPQIPNPLATNQSISNTNIPGSAKKSKRSSKDKDKDKDKKSTPTPTQPGQLNTNANSNQPQTPNHAASPGLQNAPNMNPNQMAQMNQMNQMMHHSGQQIQGQNMQPGPQNPAEFPHQHHTNTKNLQYQPNSAQSTLNQLPQYPQQNQQYYGQPRPPYGHQMQNYPIPPHQQQMMQQQQQHQQNAQPQTPIQPSVPPPNPAYQQQQHQIQRSADGMYPNQQHYPMYNQQIRYPGPPPTSGTPVQPVQAPQIGLLPQQNQTPNKAPVIQQAPQLPQQVQQMHQNIVHSQNSTNQFPNYQSNNSNVPAVSNQQHMKQMPVKLEPGQPYPSQPQSQKLVSNQSENNSTTSNPIANPQPQQPQQHHLMRQPNQQQLDIKNQRSVTDQKNGSSQFQAQIIKHEAQIPILQSNPNTIQQLNQSSQQHLGHHFNHLQNQQQFNLPPNQTAPFHQLQPGPPNGPNSVLSSKLSMNSNQSPLNNLSQMNQSLNRNNQFHSNQMNHQNIAQALPNQHANLKSQMMNQPISNQNAVLVGLNSQCKKEVAFPVESVEASLPVESKKRKIQSKDIGACDPWKFYMSLKSGLLAESTWAIDALNILLYDDNTIAYFYLKHFPGLVNILIEHFLKCLKLIFDENNGNEFKNLFVDHHSSDEQANKRLLGDSDENHSDSKLKSNGSNKNEKKGLDKHHVLRVCFSDKEMRNRYSHFFINSQKTVKFNDSKANEEWFNFNKNILKEYDLISLHEDIEEIKEEEEAEIEDEEDCKNSKRIKSSTSSSDLSSAGNHESNKLDNYIFTNFSSQNDLINLNKLYYGKYYQKRIDFNSEIKHSKKNNEKLTTSNMNNKNDSNDDFIQRHQNKELPIKDEINKSEELKYDDQAVQDEESIFKIVNQRNTELMNRCVAISTIFRNLSFVPGNDLELCKNNLLLKIFANLIVLKHEHKLVLLNNQNKDSNSQDHLGNCETQDTNDQDDQDDLDDEFIHVQDTDKNYHLFLNEQIDCIKELKNKKLIYKTIENKKSKTNQKEKIKDTKDWWWDCVHLLRENTLVTLANICGALNLNNLDQEDVELYSHGLIHWSICKSNDAQDSLCTINDANMLSPQRLAIESLSKLTVIDFNIDLILANLIKLRPFLDTFISTLCSEWLIRRDEPTLREFSIILIYAMSKCDQFAARSIAKHASALISFIEDFEDQARRHSLINPNHQHYHPNFANSNNSHHHHHHHSTSNSKVLNEDISNINEENLGTTVDMLRKCSSSLMSLSMYAENIPFIMKHEARILDLVTSQFVDFKVAQILSQVLFYCSSNSQSCGLK